jgi:hypothetical protein
MHFPAAVRRQHRLYFPVACGVLLLPIPVLCTFVVSMPGCLEWILVTVPHNGDRLQTAVPECGERFLDEMKLGDEHTHKASVNVCSHQCFPTSSSA